MCGAHFEDSQYRHPTTRKGRLVPDAVPTIFDVPPLPLTPAFRRSDTRRKRKPCCGGRDASSRRPQTKQRKEQKSDAVPILVNVPDPPPPLLTTSGRSDTPRKKKAIGDDVNSGRPTKEPREERTDPNVQDVSATQPGPSSACTAREKALKRKVKCMRHKLYRWKKKWERRHEVEEKKKKKLSTAQKKENLITELSAFLSGPALQFVFTQIRNWNKTALARRWGDDDKAFARTLFDSSQRTYRLLRKVFSLPSPSTLRSEACKQGQGSGADTHPVKSGDLQVFIRPSPSTLINEVCNQGQGSSVDAPPVNPEDLHIFSGSSPSTLRN